MVSKWYSQNCNSRRWFQTHLLSHSTNPSRDPTCWQKRTDRASYPTTESHPVLAAPVGRKYRYSKRTEPRMWKLRYVYNAFTPRMSCKHPKATKLLSSLLPKRMLREEPQGCKDDPPKQMEGEGLETLANLACLREQPWSWRLLWEEDDHSQAVSFSRTKNVSH